MNISETGNKLLNSTNVYSACNGEYHRGQRLNRKYIEESKSHDLIQTKRGIKVVIDQNANDLDEVFISRGKEIPADEILEIMKPDNLRIPMKLREEFQDVEGKELPDSDLLKAIHYFVSKKFDGVLVDKERDNKLVQSMDETALLTMGLLLESWCDELINDEVAKMFTKTYPKEEPMIIHSDDSIEDEEEEDEEDQESE